MSIRATRRWPVADACRFPPLGHALGRRTRRAAGLSRQSPLGEVNAQGNALTTLIPMLETPEAIANADAIAAVPGIDILLIGSNDLCTAIGIPGDLKHPKLRAAYESDGGSLRGAQENASASAASAATSRMWPNWSSSAARFVIAGIGHSSI